MATLVHISIGYDRGENDSFGQIGTENIALIEK